MENNNNKKTLILSIVGILVLVIAVVGVSFAMYSFTGTGTKENVITTGSVSIAWDDNSELGANNFTVSNKYPMSDAKGIAQTDSKATFAVKGDWGSATGISIKYDLGVKETAKGATLTEDYVKIALLGSDGTTVVVGNKSDAGALTGGVTIGSLKDKAGTNGLITKYALTSGTLTTSGQSDKYTVLAYVSEDYNLPTDDAKTVDSGVNHKLTTASETYKFKLTVSAAQA